VQRSFERRLAVLMRSPPRARVHVSLRHPLFPHTIHSTSVARAFVTRDTVFVLRTQLHGESKEVGFMRVSPPRLELWTEGLIEMGNEALMRAIALRLFSGIPP